MQFISGNKLAGLSLIGCLLVVGLSGCDSDSASGPAVQTRSIQGIWEREGYGDVFLMDESGGVYYQYTRASCLEVDEIDREDVADVFNDMELSADGTRLTTRPGVNPGFPVRYRRLEALPESCRDDRLITESTPTHVFEHFCIRTMTTTPFSMNAALTGPLAMPSFSLGSTMT